MPDIASLIINGTEGRAPDVSSEEFQPDKIRIFNRAVVLQTLSDPSLRDSGDDNLLKTLKNRNDYMVAPRNSVICRMITEGKGKVEGFDFVCFPLFSSHIMMPVKAGEQIWVFFEQPVVSASSRPYWVSRIAEPIFVEDANFTHGDRRYQKIIRGEGKQVDDASGNFEDDRKLTFQNGSPSQSDNATIKGDQNAFVDLIQKSKEFKLTALEPVPRITKRPGDLVLQGSNNSSITLGTSMGWDSNERPKNDTSKSVASAKEPQVGTGAIDIVTGRGRIFQTLSSERDARKGDKKDGKSIDASTRPHIEQNVLASFETDKNVATQQDESKSKDKGNTRTNPQEGDPDFLLDASRVYLSSKAEIDKMLDTGPKGVATAFENAIEEKKGASIAVKSDHIRIVARKSKLPKNQSKEPDDISKEETPTNGTIRIVKEGEPDKDLATITIEADGTIQISGSKIFLGRKKDDGGKGEGPGPGEAQPYVKYKQLEKLLTDTFDKLSKFANGLGGEFAKTATPGYGGPDAALLTANVKCIDFAAQFDSLKSEIEKLKSERIFGE